MDREVLAAISRVSEAEFERTSSELRAVRSQIAECEARLAALKSVPGLIEGGADLLLAPAALATAKWQLLRSQRLAEMQRLRATLAANEIEAHRKAARAFGRLSAISSLMD